MAVGVGIRVGAGDRPAAVDDRSIGPDGIGGIDCDFGPVFRPEKSVQGQPVEVNPLMSPRWLMARRPVMLFWKSKVVDPSASVHVNPWTNSSAPL